MKQFFLFFVILAAALIAENAVADGDPVSQVRLDYSSTNVTTGAWVSLGSLPNVVSTVQVFDSSGQTLKFGVGPSGSQVEQFIIFPGGNGIMRYNAAGGSLIWVRAISGTANAGELDLNFLN